MKFEVVRTAKEWREVLTEYEYLIMRDGLTEKPHSSLLWNETTDGIYSCKGCGLPNYTSNQKVVLDKGWVFFYHTEPGSVLKSIDGNIPEY